jgi:NTE family protein
MKHRTHPVKINQGNNQRNKNTSKINAPSSSDYHEVIENVLILQGGGSLGAFGCGVFKALCQKGIKLDIVAGTSIGGVNAAIIAGSKNVKHPEQLLEEFWLELAENIVDLESISPFSSYFEQLAASSRYFSSSISQQSKNESERTIEEYRNKAIKSFFSSAIFGNDKMFKARWRPEYAFTDPNIFNQQNGHIFTTFPL